MKKNKSRPLIKTQLAKIVVIQVAILLAFLVLFTVKETDQTLLIWRNTNARTCQSLLNEYQSDLKQAAAVTAYPVQPTVRVQTDSIYNEFSHQPQEYSQAFKMKIYSDLKSWFTSGRFFSKIAVYDMEGRGLVLMPANNYYVEETTELQADWYQQALDGKGSAVIGLYTSTDYMGNAIADPQLLVARSIVRAEQMKSIGIMTVTVDLGDLERVFSEQFAQPGQSFTIFYGNKQIAGEKIKESERENIQGKESRILLRDGKLYDLQHVRAGEFSCMIYTPLSQILLGGVSFSLFMFAIVVVLLMCLTVAIIHIVHQINGPMQKLVEICEGMKANDLVEIDDFGMPQELWTLTAAINRMLARVRHLIDENYSIKLEAKNTELQLLRSQINPHYLYNTLEYIHVAAYNKKDYDVSRMAELLGKNLQYGLRDTNRTVSLSTELEKFREYFDLVSYHYQERAQLAVFFEDGIMDQEVIKLLLQPLVENALKYGFRDSQTKLRIEMLGYRREDCVYITVSDDGAGMSSSNLHIIRETLKGREQTNSIGLQNVNRRLKLVFGEAYGLSVESKQGEGTSVLICMPYRPWKEDK